MPSYGTVEYAYTMPLVMALHIHVCAQSDVKAFATHGKAITFQRDAENITDRDDGKT